MKLRKIIATTITALFSLSAYPDTVTPSTKVGGIHLDQTKGVLFEQLAPNTFTLQLLQAKNQFDPYDLIFGGMAEFDWQHWQGDTINLTPPGKYHKGHGLYFTQATLDIMDNFSRWTMMFFSIADSHIGRPGLSGNYVYLPRTMIALGNLDVLPIYGTFGINTIPFGVFTGSGSWDSPLTASYFNPIEAPQLNISYFKNNWNFNAAGYSDQISRHNNFSYSVYYNKSVNDDFGYGAGAGYLTNLETTSAGNPTIKETHTVVKNGRHRNVRIEVPAGRQLGSVWDFNANIYYKEVTLNAEYVHGSAVLFPNTDKANAYSFAATFTPTIAGKDTTFGVCYSRANHLKNIPTSLPGSDSMLVTNAGLKSEWAVSVTRSVITKNIYLGFDLQDTATFFNHKTYTGTVDLSAYL